ncbi:MAG: hypothetical protein GY870_09685 [archaeon]|nr:hypothetical protein [archaeon]
MELKTKGGKKLLCKTCIKCKEYISIHENFLGHKRLEIFEQIHTKHPMVYLDCRELKDYENIDQKIDQKIKEKKTPTIFV